MDNSPFGRLSPEIRNMIYEYVFDTSGEYMAIQWFADEWQGDGGYDNDPLL